MKKVSVVIPSYNRAHLLSLTIPTYIQEDVGELIIVDDCSLDDTENVVAALKKQYPIIKYLKNDSNRRQCFSKNRGIQNATCDYIYFVDDDSVLGKGAIRLLLENVTAKKADIAGARALYAGNYVSLNHIKAFENWRTKKDIAPQGKKIAELEPFRSSFNLYIDEPSYVPYTPACMLASRQVCKEILFDEKFVGCAYREETDFCIRNLLCDRKILYVPEAVQINLPPKIVRKTGAHSGGRETWLKSAYECNRYFFEKNWNSLCEKFNLQTSLEEIVAQTESDIFELYKKQHGDSFFKEVAKKLFFSLFVLPRFGEKK